MHLCANEKRWHFYPWNHCPWMRTVDTEYNDSILYWKLEMGGYFGCRILISPLIFWKHFNLIVLRTIISLGKVLLIFGNLISIKLSQAFVCWHNSWCFPATSPQKSIFPSSKWRFFLSFNIFFWIFNYLSNFRQNLVLLVLDSLSF